MFNKKSVADWDCPDCGNRVFGSKRECGKCGKWKPKPEFTVKKGDWNCSNCSDTNFASRDRCRKCGFSKPVIGLAPRVAPGTPGIATGVATSGVAATSSGTQNEEGEGEGEGGAGE